MMLIKDEKPHSIRVSNLNIILIIVAFLISSLSCAFLSSGPDSEATEEAKSLDDLLTYKVPISVLTLEPGETIPYTQLGYQEHVGSIYRVLIDNQVAEKRVGDSFRWRGVIAPGVSASYDLRIAPTFSQDNMLLGGSVELAVFSPVPVEIEGEPANVEGRLHFSGIFTDYEVQTGQFVPGTTLTYLGQSEQGAELSGVDGYPFRSVGDSVIWSGRLRENVNVRYSLRVISIKDESLRLIGTAELWMTPHQ